MDWVLQIIKDTDLGTLVSIGAMIWFFYQRLSSKVDKMQDIILDIDRRLCRLEGAFQSKDCCIMKSDTSIKKVE